MYRYFFLGFCVMMAATAGAFEPKPGVHPMTFESTADGSREPYNLFIPTKIEGGQPLPLAVVLHGKGATWQSWFAGTTVTQWAEEAGYAVAAPHGRGDWFYLGAGGQDVLDIIGHVKQRLPIDESRIYLIGHSMGGWGTWHFGASHPDLFAAIVPMAGWAPMELLGNLRNTPPFVIHGDRDDIVLPDRSREAIAELARLGISYRYFETRGYGHESAMISDMLPIITQWLEEHRRIDRPNHVHFATRTPVRGSAWWLRIEQLHDPLMLATANARIDGETIVLETENIRHLAILPGKAPLVPGRDIRIATPAGTLEAPWPEDGAPIRLTWEVSGPAPSLTNNAPAAAERDPLVAEIENMPEDLPLAIARLLAVHVSEADAAILARDLIVPKLISNRITTSMVIDSFLWPQDHLVLFTLTQEQFAELQSHPEYLPRWWGDLAVGWAEEPREDAETLRIVVPEVLALRLPWEGEKLDGSVRAAIHAYLKETGEFPR